MSKPFTDEDAGHFVGSMQFLETMWGIKTDYSVDSETGRGVVRLWMPGTEVVLHINEVDVRRIRVIERNRQRFADAPPVET